MDAWHEITFVDEWYTSNGFVSFVLSASWNCTECLIDDGIMMLMGLVKRVKLNDS